MEVDHHEGLHPCCLHIEWAEEEKEEEELVLLSRDGRGGRSGGGGRGEAGDTGTLGVTLRKYIIISNFFAFSFL